MELNEGLSRLWFEKQVDSNDSKNAKTCYQTKNFRFHSSTLRQMRLFIRKEKINYCDLLCSTFGLILNRFTSTDHFPFGYAATYKRAKTLRASFPVYLVHATIDENMHVKSFLNKTQPKKNNSFQDNIPVEIRYFILERCNMTKTNKKKTEINLDPHRYPCILIFDNKNINSISFAYAKDLYQQKDILNLIEHFELALLAIINHLKSKVIQLDLLTARERKLLLNKWNKPDYPFDTTVPDQCVHELFWDVAKKFPSNIAVNHNELNITYQELEKASNQFAKYLIKKGVKIGDRITVLMERTPTIFMVMLAIFKCGGVYIPINPKFPDERIEFILSDTDAKFIIVNAKERIANKHQSKILLIKENWNELNPASFERSLTLPKVNSNNLAYIIYTSGTTGQPKGVMISHFSLTNLVVWYKGCFQISEKDRASQFASAGFDTFLCECIPFLSTGGSVHIVDDNIKLTPTLFFNWIQKHEITICDLPTAYSKILFAMQWPEKLALKFVKIGGETVTQYPHGKYSFDIWDGYGPTETTIEATFAKIYSANDEQDQHFKYTIPPIGKPIANLEIYVLDRYLQPVPVGVAGELLIGGYGVALGYLNRLELTHQKFVTLPFLDESKQHEKFYRTGDLVRFRSDGNLDFIGRIDHQVKIRGYRIELGDIESAISQHSDVSEVAVVAKENINGQKSLIAYVVPNLNKARFLYQERCLLSIDENRFVEVLTEDISKQGLALTGLTETLEPGQTVKLHVKLPGLTEARLFRGHVIWQSANRCGIGLDLSQEEKNIVDRSIDYYLSTHNVMELVLTAAAKRSLRKALGRKIPEYMVPSTFVSLLQFPLTYSGKIDLKALPPPQNYEDILRKENILPKTETEKALVKVWSELLNQDKISMSDSFFDLGGTSITAAELSVKILNQFNISIPTKILFDLPYVPILAEYIDSKGQKYATESIIQEEIQRDSILHDNISPVKKLSPSPKYPQNILLTGAGGFLGIYLLRELLATTESKIFCLVRKGEFETAAKRLISTIHRFHLEKDISMTDRRIVVIASDISFDNFGLPFEQYQNMLEKVDLIYHCGAQVNIMASYNKLRGSNVQGTLEVIKFASKGVIKPIHYVSTLSAACNYDEAGSLAEVFPSVNYDELFGGYAISKWVSERLLTQIKNRGVPVGIYRSGYISGQSDNGMTNLNDALFMLIKGCIQLGFAPEMEEKITILPVDFVSKATVGISLLKSHESCVYHVDHPTGIMWSDLISWLNEYGYQIKLIPIKKWQSMLLNIDVSNALYPFLPYYLAMKENFKSPNVSIKNTTRVLKQLKLPYPEINERLLTTYFDFLCRINFIPIPSQVEPTE